MIFGLYADEADRLRPDVWVNVWAIGDGGAEFYGDCRVEDLDVSDSDYGIKPVDEEGNPVPLKDALKLEDGEEQYLKSKGNLKCYEMLACIAG